MADSKKNIVPTKLTIPKALIAPLGFSKVQDGIYRSAYPAAKSLNFISQLNLKSMVCLNPNDIKPELEEYCNENLITLFKSDIKYNQDPFVVMSDCAMNDALDFALNPENQPTLLFCTTGKVRTGCAVGCLRKRTNWCMSSIIQEYEQYTDPESGLGDMHFIDAFE
eukprot:CAMPEP_0170370714 /NCGR_PEP_ID=MMETSP0117_2-20130122/8654_1 /TAXON_ID=400756 /ORGANISM="Durinskia baltica, Strain CSIRO CS-38" /LENGTH=165 /DNA_ID=CAMNT_0010625499 /DNA_START=46 /DNA_END=543 /DNA_ORIENTATION=+